MKTLRFQEDRKRKRRERRDEMRKWPKHKKKDPGAGKPLKIWKEAVLRVNKISKSEKGQRGADPDGLGCAILVTFVAGRGEGGWTDSAVPSV